MHFRRVSFLTKSSRARSTRNTVWIIAMTLVNAITLNAQVSPPHATRSESPLNTKCVGRIVSIVALLADQARMSRDLAFAVRAQSRAASLLWPYDRKRARIIYRRTFKALTVQSSGCDGSDTPRATTSHRVSYVRPSSIDTRHLRVELLHEIAERDVELADELVGTIKPSIARPNSRYAIGSISWKRNDDNRPSSYASPTAAATRRDIEQRDLLVSVAIQIADREPIRASALGQSSLAGGVSPHFSTLLLSLHESDAERATLLFLNALDILKRSSGVDLSALHTLGAFLISVTDPQGKQSINKSSIVRFLNYALRQLALCCRKAGDKRLDTCGNHVIDDHETVIYFIGRQLGELFERYKPDRLNQFNRRIAELTPANMREPSSTPEQIYPSDPKELSDKASVVSVAADRDLLYARAVYALLARRETDLAQASASQIVDPLIRERVTIEIARRYNSAGRLDDAAYVARLIRDPAVRAQLLTSLARTALSNKDEAWVTGLLDEAVSCALQSEPSKANSSALSEIAGTFALFHPMRGFEVMQTTVDRINKVTAQRKASQSRRSNPALAGADDPSEFYGGSLEDTFSSLASADFERALCLSRQLVSNDISVFAQLAVCRGGLKRASRETCISLAETTNSSR